MKFIINYDIVHTLMILVVCGLYGHNNHQSHCNFQIYDTKNDFAKVLKVYIVVILP